MKKAKTFWGLGGRHPKGTEDITTFWRYEWVLWEIENAKIRVELAVIFFLNQA